jgi:hypothetical protein
MKDRAGQGGDGSEVMIPCLHAGMVVSTCLYGEKRAAAERGAKAEGGQDTAAQSAGTPSQLPVKQLDDEVVNLLRDPCLGKGGSHQPARALKFDTFRQLGGGGDFFGVCRSFRERSVGFVF